MSSRISADVAPPTAQLAPAPLIDHAANSAEIGFRRAWILQLALLIGVEFWLIAWHWETAASMAQIWWTSETFAHGLVIYPACLWLVWRKRHVISRLEATPCYWALVPLAGAGFGWLVATAGGVQAGQHLCLVMAIALLPWVVLGTRIARALAFPLVFSLFAAPIGDFLMPIMMQHTADFTVAALRLVDMPVYREGLQFVIPSGRWSVVEACSGLRYLIASAVLGCLFAYLTYRSYWRRAAFIAASIATPIVANWIRAFMIVMVGHFSGMKLAVGVDHLIYGWVFFGFVMLLLFWIGSYWRDDQGGNAGSDDRPAPAKAGIVNARAGLLATVSAATVVASAPLYAEHLQESLTARQISIAVPVVDGWVAEPSAAAFQPRYNGARARVTQSYARGSERVEIFVGYYAAQGEGTELINFNNTIVPSSDAYWQKVGEQSLDVIPDRLSVIQTNLKGSGGALRVWHWYWVGGRWTASREQAKLLHALSLLLGQGDDAAIVAVHGRVDPSVEDRSAKRLEEFTKAALPAIESALLKARSTAHAQPDARPPAGG